MKRQLDSSVTPLFTFEEAPGSEFSPVSSYPRGVSPELRNKRRKISEESSSIPYTWDETEVDNTEQSHALEQHLLNLLHVGVYPQVLCSEITNTVLVRRYWSLAELWALLEERKSSWSNEAGNKKRASPEPNMEQLATAEAESDIQEVHEVPEVNTPDHVKLVNVDSIENQMPKEAPDSNVTCEAACSVSNNLLPQPPSVLEQEQEQDGSCQASDKPGCLSLQATKTLESQDRFIDILNEDQCEPLPQESTENEVVFPASVPEVEQPHISDIEFYELGRVDDDDVFYRTLDAAYSAIVRPGVAAEVASDLQHLLESPELNATDLPNSPESIGIRDSDIPAPKVEPVHLATVSQDAIQERFDEWPSEPSCQPILPTSHFNDPCVELNNDMPWLTAGYGESQPRASAEIDARQSQAPELSDFWRQNKLY
jgi:hypothetical protein